MTPTIDVFGLTIAESTTTITDYLITAVAWWLGVRLVRGAIGRRQYSHWLWGLGFLFVGLGALLGGTSHGFVAYLSDATLSAIWKGTAYAVGLSMLFAVAGTIEGSFLRKSTRRTFHLINALGFVLYAIWMVNHSAFIYIIYHYVSAMISVALIQVWAFVHHRAATAPWIIAGVIITLAGAVIQQSGFSLHTHFNNNDLYHVVQIVGLALLYRGASQLESTVL